MCNFLLCLADEISNFHAIRKPIKISGTNFILDTPESVQYWIQERKKRWPSAKRIDSRKRYKSAALARGEIEMDILTIHQKQSGTNKATSHACETTSRSGCSLQSATTTITTL